MHVLVKNLFTDFSNFRAVGSYIHCFSSLLTASHSLDSLETQLLPFNFSLITS